MALRDTGVHPTACLPTPSSHVILRLQLSHQLLNPLHSLIGTLDHVVAVAAASTESRAAAFASGAPPPRFPVSPLRDSVADMTGAAAQMDRVLADVAAHQALLSGSVTLQRQPVDARALVRNLAIAFQAEYQRPVIPVVADRSLPRLLIVDPVRLAQALSYGLANAIAASPSGAPVSVHMLRVVAPLHTVVELNPAVLFSNAARRVVVLDAGHAYLHLAGPSQRSLQAGVPALSDVVPPVSPSSLRHTDTALVRVVGLGGTEPEP